MGKPLQAIETLMEIYSVRIVRSWAVKSSTLNSKLKMLTVPTLRGLILLLNKLLLISNNRHRPTLTKAGILTLVSKTKRASHPIHYNKA